jgi:pilus assembly protein Flp/PilA
MRGFIARFVQDESGSNALEYGLIVALVSLAIVAGATTAGTALGAMFTALGTKVATITAGI